MKFGVIHTITEINEHRIRSNELFSMSHWLNTKTKEKEGEREAKTLSHAFTHLTWKQLVTDQVQSSQVSATPSVQTLFIDQLRKNYKATD